MIRNLISTCIVLLLSVQIIVGQKDGQESSFKSYDEWALHYEPEENPGQHMEYLRESVQRAQRLSEAEGVKISAFEVSFKIRDQHQEGEVNEGLVYEARERLYSTVAESGCEVTTDSDYLSLSGSVRNIFYASVVCQEQDRYFQLVENHGFWSNVLFMRATDKLDTGIKGIRTLIPGRDWEAIPFPWYPDPPINPCADYTTTPWRNWHADAMHGGKIDCQLLTDDCAYNKGRGGHLIMIDTGIASHPELTPLVAAGRVTQRHFFSAPELAATDPYLDTMGHGTSLASLAVGKFVGLTKQATLESIKVTMDNSDKVSLYAVVAAVNQIIKEQKNKGKTRITPTVIFGGIGFTWTEKEMCYITYMDNPSKAVSIKSRDVSFNDTRLRAPGVPAPSIVTPLTPNPWSVDPPKSYGTFGYTYDCSYTLVNALRTIISFGIPYLVPSGNGVEYWDVDNVIPYSAGYDRCFATRWLNAVPMCMQADEYTYSPLFMTSGFRSDPTNGANAGYINRAVIIGGYGKDFKNARWSDQYIADNNTDDNYINVGGANYGSQWNMYNMGERCVDYAAPAAGFENMPVISGLAYGASNSTYFWNGMTFGDYGIPQAPFSGTSYATPLAAGSILETLIRYWSALRPTAYFPDYTFGDKVINAVDNNNVIWNSGTGKIKVSNEQCYVDMYDFFSFWVSHPTPVAYFNCADKYGYYYTSNAYPSNVAEINVPHNRNLFMPAYRSTEKYCNLINPQPQPQPFPSNPPNFQIRSDLNQSE